MLLNLRQLSKKSVVKMQCNLNSAIELVCGPTKNYQWKEQTWYWNPKVNEAVRVKRKYSRHTTSYKGRNCLMIHTRLQVPWDESELPEAPPTAAGAPANHRLDGHKRPWQNEMWQICRPLSGIIIEMVNAAGNNGISSFVSWSHLTWYMARLQRILRWATS